MDVYAHEKEQIENIKNWWRENRWYIVAGLLISAAIVGGWRYWQEYRLQQAEAASVRYENVLTSATAGDIEATRSGVAGLRSDYAGTPYAALGSLRLAALLVGTGDYDGAAESLRWAMDNSGDEELVSLARLRLARVMLQQGDADGAAALLAGRDAGKFQPLYDETRGDALLIKGDRDGARAAYEAALAGMEPELGDRETLNRKLQNVALPAQAFAVERAPADAAEAEDSGDSQE